MNNTGPVRWIISPGKHCGPGVKLRTNTGPPGSILRSLASWSCCTFCLIYFSSTLVIVFRRIKSSLDFGALRSNISSGERFEVDCCVECCVSNLQAIASSSTVMGQTACVSLVPWMTEPLSLLSYSLTSDRGRGIYAVFHWRMWIHGTRHLWTTGRCHSQYNLTNNEWWNNTPVSQLCFGSLCSATGTLPTIWCANTQPLGTRV